MKHTCSLLILILLLASCSKEKKQSVEAVMATNNLEQIRLKRTDIVAKQQDIIEELKQLDQKIAELDTTKRIPLISTFIAKADRFDHYLELQGNVSTKKLLTVYPEFSGVLLRVHVKEGQRVSKGQLLAKVDDGGMSQQLAQAQIQANLSKTTFERQQRLWHQNIGSEIQFLQAKSNYNAQTAAVSQMQKQIAKTAVKAPFSGTIDQVITEQGSVVGAGQSPLMRIVNLDNMFIETDVPERYISDVVKNKKVVVEFPVLGKTIDTKIRQAAAIINPTNRTFRVEIGVPNKDHSIRPNLTAKLKINDYTNKNALLIPLSIISENAKGEQYIYVVGEKNTNNQGVAKRVIIKTGKSQGDLIEVLEGIANDAEIIKEGARTVKDGQTVKVINTKSVDNLTNN